MTDFKLAYIRWKDAQSEEASEPLTEARAHLVELEEVGFLLDENEEAVLIGQEIQDDAKVQAGRFRLHIPRSQIVEMRVVDVKKAFPKRSIVIG